MKVLEVIEAPKIERWPGYYGIRVERQEGIALVHWNWFAERKDKGLPEVQVGSDVDFQKSFEEPDGYYRVRNFTVIQE